MVLLALREFRSVVRMAFRPFAPVLSVVAVEPGLARGLFWLVSGVAVAGSALGDESVLEVTSAVLPASELTKAWLFAVVATFTATTAPGL